MIPAQYFDFLGLFAFIFLSILGFFMIKKKQIPKWVPYVLLFIGIIGFIIDGYNLIVNFILN